MKKRIFTCGFIAAALFSQLSLASLTAKADTDIALQATPDDAVYLAADMQPTAPKNAAYLEIVEKSKASRQTKPDSPVFSYEGIEAFASDLRDKYIPVMLANIERKFDSINPSVDGLGLGLVLDYSFSDKAMASIVVNSQGTEYALKVNMARLTATAEGNVDIYADNSLSFGNMQHELMHAVMFDVTSAAMLGKEEWSGFGTNSRREIIVDSVPAWFYEGIAQAAGGGMGHVYPDNLTGYYDLYKHSSTSALGKRRIHNWLSKFYYLNGAQSNDLAYPAYSQGYIATMYLGYIASGETEINAENIVNGLDDILKLISDGHSFSESIYLSTRDKSKSYISIDDFKNRFAEDAFDFTVKVYEKFESHRTGSFFPAGSILSPEGLTGSKSSLYSDNAEKSSFFTLHTEENSAFDNSALLRSVTVISGGGNTLSERLRKDGSINTSAFKKWDGSVFNKLGTILNYKTEHYLPDDNSNGFRLQQTVESSDEFHKYISAQALSFEGYEPDTANYLSKTADNLDEDGMILKVYYKKKSDSPQGNSGSSNSITPPANSGSGNRNSSGSSSGSRSGSGSGRSGGSGGSGSSRRGGGSGGSGSSRRGGGSGGSARSGASAAVKSGTDSGSWKRNEKGWWFEYTNKAYPVNAWKEISSSSYNSKYWYYFGNDGYMLKGWQIINNKWYYLYEQGSSIAPEGAMAKDTVIGGYKVGSDGAYIK